MVEDFWTATNAILKKYSFYPIDIDKLTSFKATVDDDSTVVITTSHLCIPGNFLIVNFAMPNSFREPADMSMYSALGKYAFVTWNKEVGNTFVYSFTRVTANAMCDEVCRFQSCLAELMEYWKTVKVVDVPQLGE